MAEIWGVLAAALSSALGGASIGVTRYVRDVVDPLAIGAFRFGLGFAFLFPVALINGGKWPARADWLAVAGLGLLFFAVFPILFNASLMLTTAARGSLALSTLPLLTMMVAASLGVEGLTARKTIGVLIAMMGVAIALLSGLSSAPPGAWRGDALMLCAAICMAFYSVWSRPIIRRSGPLQFTTMGMGIGAIVLIGASTAQGSFSTVSDFRPPQWSAMIYLGLFGSALTFFLWSFALSRTTPTRVAISIAVNPIAAAFVGAIILDEPIGWSLIVGVSAVAIGIWVATTAGRLHSFNSSKGI